MQVADKEIGLLIRSDEHSIVVRYWRTPALPLTLTQHKSTKFLTVRPEARHFSGGSMIASRFVSRCSNRIFAASLSSVPLKGSYTAITEQLWRQREEAKLRDACASSSVKSSSMAPKPQKETLVVYDFPGDARLKDEYSNPWGDVR